MCASEGCQGWVLVDGQDSPCPDEVHKSRMVRAGTAQVLADITPRMWDWWCKKGWIDTVRAPGSGHARLITEWELGRLRVMAEYVANGMDPRKASGLAWLVWSFKPVPPPFSRGPQ